MNRRKVLQALGLGAVAGPAAAKKMAEQQALQLQIVKDAGIAMGGISGYNESPGIPECHAGQFSHILTNIFLRKQFEALLYEDEYYVTRIDPDLAAKRSFSLAAKIAFQRQRNVARRLGDLERKHSWARVSDFLHNNRIVSFAKAAVGMFGQAPR